MFINWINMFINREKMFTNWIRVFINGIVNVYKLDELLFCDHLISQCG